MIDGRYRVLADNLSPETTTYVARNMPTNTPLHFLVQRFDDGMWSSDSVSNTTTAYIPSTIVPLPGPNSISTESGEKSIDVSFSYINSLKYMEAYVEQYAVSLYVNGTYQVISSSIPANQKSFVITGLNSNWSYYILVQARIGGRWSSDDLSQVKPASTRPNPMIPTSPIFLLTNHPTRSSALLLQWNKNTGAARYAVSILQANGSYRVIDANISPNQTSYTISGLNNWQEYHVLLQAQMDGRWSDDSHYLLRAATPKPVIVPAPPFIIKSYGDYGITIQIQDNGQEYERYAVAMYANGRYQLLTANLKSNNLTVVNVFKDVEYVFLVQWYHRQLQRWSSDMPQNRRVFTLNPK